LRRGGDYTAALSLPKGSGLRMGNSLSAQAGSFTSPRFVHDDIVHLRNNQNAGQYGFVMPGIAQGYILSLPGFMGASASQL